MILPPLGQKGSSPLPTKTTVPAGTNSRVLAPLTNNRPISKPTPTPTLRPVATTQPIQVQKKQTPISQIQPKSFIGKTAKGISDKLKNLPEAHFADNENFFTPVGFAKTLAQGFINTPSQAFKGSTSFGEHLVDRNSHPKQVAADLAAAAQLPLLFIGGGEGASAVKTVAKEGIKAIGKTFAKEGLVGAGFGLLGGVQGGKDIKNNVEYARNLLVNTGIGIGTAGVFTGLTHVAVPLAKGLSSKLGAVFIKDVNKTPKIEKIQLDPKVAQTVVVPNEGLTGTPVGKAIVKESLKAQQVDGHVAIILDPESKLKLPSGEGVRIETVAPYEPTSAQLEHGNALKRIREPEKYLSELDRASTEKVKADPIKLRDEYIAKFGKEVNTDHARELFKDEGYVGHNSPEVQNASAAVKDIVYDHLIDTKKGEGNNTVLFTGGGSGSGKTKTLEVTRPDTESFPVIYDSTLGGKSTEQKISQALDNGYKAHIVYTVRDIVDAWENGVLKRERVVGEKYHIDSHLESRKKILHLIEKFKDDERVKVEVVDNMHGIDNIKVVDDPVAFIKEIGYNEATTRKAIENATEQALKDQRISAEHHKGFTNDRENNGAKSEAGTATGNERPTSEKSTEQVTSKAENITKGFKTADDFVNEFARIAKESGDRAFNDPFLKLKRITPEEEAFRQKVFKYTSQPEVIKKYKAGATDKEILTELFNKENATKVEPQVKDKPQTGNPTNQEPVGTGKLRESQAYKHFIEDLEQTDPETFAKIKDDPKLLYNKVNQKYDFENAAKLVEQDPQKAYNIAKGYENAPEGQRQNSVAIVLSNQALKEGNIELVRDIEQSLSLRATREGQEIVALKGRFDVNSPQAFMKEVLATRLENIGRKVGDIVDTKGQKIKAAKQKAVAKIDEQVERAIQFTKKQKQAIDFGQKFLDEITCK